MPPPLYDLRVREGPARRDAERSQEAEQGEDLAEYRVKL